MKDTLSPFWRSLLSILFISGNTLALIRYALVVERYPHYTHVLDWLRNWCS